MAIRLNKQIFPAEAETARAWQIRAETLKDREAVERLVNLAFGPGRFAKTAYRLREGVFPDQRLSFVAEDRDSGELWGSVRFWPVVIGGTSALLLGPLAVMPELRGRGIGLSLMQHGISAAGGLNEYAAIVLVGDETYYAKVGFAKLNLGQVGFPGPVDPDRVLGLPLKQGALDTLKGDVRRARIDVPVSAASVGVG